MKPLQTQHNCLNAKAAEKFRGIEIPRSRLPLSLSVRGRANTRRSLSICLSCRSMSFKCTYTRNAPSFYRLVFLSAILRVQCRKLKKLHPLRGRPQYFSHAVWIASTRVIAPLPVRSLAHIRDQSIKCAAAASLIRRSLFLLHPNP